MTRSTSILTTANGGSPNGGADLPFTGETRACTQVVQCFKNPATGEKRLATDGCVAQTLREQGWVGATGCPPPGAHTGGGGDNGNGNGATTAPTRAGGGGAVGAVLLLGAGAALAAALA